MTSKNNTTVTLDGIEFQCKEKYPKIIIINKENKTKQKKHIFFAPLLILCTQNGEVFFVLFFLFSYAITQEVQQA